MKMILSIALLIIAFRSHSQSASEHRIPPLHFTLNEELKAFYDMSALPLYRDGSIEAQISSWDTTGGNDDGFSGKYSFVKRNKDSSLVLFDIRGAGVINRIWTPTPTEDTLDFFIDDSLLPVLSISFGDLFSGKIFPFIKPLCGNQLGGYYCYFPILFQKNCRIVSRAKKMQFYQIQYRLYPGNALVQSFNPNLDKKARGSLAAIARLWNKEDRNISDFLQQGEGDLQTVVKNIEIRPGQSAWLLNLHEGGRILGIEFYLDDHHTEFNKNIDLQIRWDDDENPAVDCPLADFFGYAFGVPSMESLLLGSRKQIRYCYFPMPFDRKADIQLVYRKSNSTLPALAVKAKIYYTKNKRDSIKEGRFYSCWKSNALHKESGPHVFLNTNGKGHYIGTLLQASGFNPGMTYFFEGDDSTATDGIFRIHGTGSEDYFNGGWYALPDRWDAKMSLPLHGCLDYSLLFCRTGGYRFYLSDKLPFERNIFQSIEHGPVGNETPVVYTSLAFYYCNTAPDQLTKPVNCLTETVVPDTLMVYPQLTDFNIQGAVQIKPMGIYPTGGTAFLFTINDESLLRLRLEDLPAGNYKVYADFAKIPEGCSFSLWQRQTRISDWISTRSPARERVELLFLGKMKIRDFQQTLSFQFKTDSTHTGFFLNRLILVRDRENAKISR